MGLQVIKKDASWSERKTGKKGYAVICSKSTFKHHRTLRRLKERLGEQMRLSTSPI